MLRFNFQKFLNKRSILLLICLLSANCILYLNEINNIAFINVLKDLLIANVAIFISIYFFINYKHLSNNILKTLGFYSLHIYVIHCFFTAGIRILMQKLDFLNIFVYFTTSIILGILVPIFIGKLCNKNALLNFPFAPLNALKTLFSSK